MYVSVCVLLYSATVVVWNIPQQLSVLHLKLFCPFLCAGPQFPQPSCQILGLLFLFFESQPAAYQISLGSSYLLVIVGPYSRDLCAGVFWVIHCTWPNMGHHSCTTMVDSGIVLYILDRAFLGIKQFGHWCPLTVFSYG